jgi:hypothetical protein
VFGMHFIDYSEAKTQAHRFLIPFGFAAGAVIEVTVPSAL